MVLRSSSELTALVSLKKMKMGVVKLELELSERTKRLFSKLKPSMRSGDTLMIFAWANLILSYFDSSVKDSIVKLLVDTFNSLEVSSFTVDKNESTLKILEKSTS